MHIINNGAINNDFIQMQIIMTKLKKAPWGEGMEVVIFM